MAAGLAVQTDVGSAVRTAVGLALHTAVVLAVHADVGLAVGLAVQSAVAVGLAVCQRVSRSIAVSIGSITVESVMAEYSPAADYPANMKCSTALIGLVAAAGTQVQTAVPVAP